MRILKHELYVEDDWKRLDIKGGVVKVEFHIDTVCMWFIEHEPDQRERAPEFKVIGTGWEIFGVDVAADGFASKVTYVGTAIDHRQGLVWHVMARG